MSCGDLRSLSQITEETFEGGGGCSQCDWEKRRRRRSSGPTCSHTQCVACTTKPHNGDMKGHGGGGGGGGG